MNCKEVRYKLTLYASEELKSKACKDVKAHLNACNDCSALFFELETTMGLMGRKKREEPNPFLFTQIRERLSDQKVKDIPVSIPVYQRILHTGIVTLLLTAALFSGIEIGETLIEDQRNPSLYTQDTEFYFNDLEYEPLETSLLSDEEFKQ